jgi:hypothetical protein
MVNSGRIFRMHKKAFVAAFSIGCILLFGGCTPTTPFSPDSADTTPPELTEVLVQLQSGNPPSSRGDFGIISADANQSGIASDVTIRLVVVARDPESGISSIRVIGANDPPVNRANLIWACALATNPETTGLPGRADLFSGLPTPTAPTMSWSIDAVADPIGAIAGSDNATNPCVTGATGAGPWNISGYVRVIVTNGAGLTTTSGSFLYDYADVGHPQ